MTKLELTQRLAAVIAERDALSSKCSALEVQLAAQHAHVPAGHAGFQALLAELKARQLAGEKVKLVGRKLVHQA